MGGPRSRFHQETQPEDSAGRRQAGRDPRGDRRGDYLNALPITANRDVVKLAASIQAIDAKHAAILYFVLGGYPVPDVFAQRRQSRRPGRRPPTGCHKPTEPAHTTVRSGPPAAQGAVAILNFMFMPDPVVVGPGTSPYICGIHNYMTTTSSRRVIVPVRPADGRDATATVRSVSPGDCRGRPGNV